MAPLTPPRILASAIITCSLLVLAASPAFAVKIPEREYVPAGMTSVIHLRVDAGCDGAPTDGLEVRIPGSLSGVIPEAAPGWVVETETVAADSDTTDGSTERVSTIRWTGGILPDGQFMDFGFRARFPDEVGTEVTFPVTQTCGTVQNDWTGSEDGHPALVVRIDRPVAPQDIASTVASVEVLLADVGQIQEQIGAVNVTGVRDRVESLEAAAEKLETGLTNLRERLKAVELVLPGSAP